jgi:hypothetical protein
MHERIRADETRAERPGRAWAAPSQRNDVQRVLALQATAGNAAVARMLRSRASGAQALVQRAPLHAVMGLKETFFFGNADMPGYARYKDMPRGYHVTIYPNNLTSPQRIGALALAPLGEIDNYAAITFDAFNVTRNSDKKHFYFDELGNVVWAGTQREASFKDAGWDDAVKAAVVIYGLLGVNTSETALHQQLYRQGRQLSAARAGIAVATPTPATTPVTGQGGKPKLLKPRIIKTLKRPNEPDKSVEPPEKRLRETKSPDPSVTEVPVLQTPAPTQLPTVGEDVPVLVGTSEETQQVSKDIDMSTHETDF